MSSSIELASQLGLKPYEEFERALSPLLKRLPTEQLSEILKKIYLLAAEKTIDECDRKETLEWAQELQRRRQSVSACRTHLKTATDELLAAQTKFHPELPKWLDVAPMVEQLKRLDTFLADKETLLNRFAGVLADPTGSQIAHHGPAMIIPLDPPFLEFEGGAVFPGRGVTDLDDPFVAALDECLPSAPEGRRRRFDRDKVIAKVFGLLWQGRTKSSITQARRRIKRATGS